MDITKQKHLLQNKNFKFKGAKSKSKIIKRKMEKRKNNAMMVVRENLRISPQNGGERNLFFPRKSALFFSHNIWKSFVDLIIIRFIQQITNLLIKCHVICDHRWSHFNLYV